MARKGKALPYSRHRVDVGLPQVETIQLYTESRRVWTPARVCPELITREHNTVYMMRSLLPFSVNDFHAYLHNILDGHDLKRCHTTVE